MNEKKQSKKILIEDPLIAPYKIERDQYSFSVHKSPMEYFSTLHGALARIAELKIINKYDRQTITIKQYINEYKQLLKEFEKIVP